MDARLLPFFSALQHMVDEGDDRSSPNAPLSKYVQDTKAMASTPADVKEYPNSYAFVIDMPGLKSGDIKVQLEDENVLVISGERKREEEKEGAKYVRMERRIGKFMRKFALPENANVEAISATCQDGVLTVTVDRDDDGDDSVSLSSKLNLILLCAFSNNVLAENTESPSSCSPWVLYSRDMDRRKRKKMERLRALH